MTAGVGIGRVQVQPVSQLTGCASELAEYSDTSHVHPQLTLTPLAAIFTISLSLPPSLGNLLYDIRHSDTQIHKGKGLGAI